MNEVTPAPISGSSQQTFQVLVLEPEEKLEAEIISALEAAAPGTSSVVARSVAEAQKLVVRQKPELFVLDVDATYDQAQEFIYDLRTSHPKARAIVLTATHFSARRDQIAGLGAIHYLEKPLPRGDFITLVEALLSPDGRPEGERFQGTLSDLHISDIIQLKCISGATSMLEFTGPRGEKARVYFENGQVRHATSPGKEGLDAFNEIVDWKGGVISEVAVPPGTPRTIMLDWQMLLLDAVRKSDESREEKAASLGHTPGETAPQTVLVIDDSMMLLSFVKEILSEQHYHVVAAATGAEGLRECHTNAPDLILLDYVLPDMKGDEVCRKLVADPITSKIPVIYMSGFGTDLRPDRREIPNVIGALSKPFTSEALIESVRQHLRREGSAANGTTTEAVSTKTETNKMTSPNEKEKQPAQPNSLGEAKDEKKIPTEPSRAENATAVSAIAGPSTASSPPTADKPQPTEMKPALLESKFAPAKASRQSSTEKTQAAATKPSLLASGAASATVASVTARVAASSTPRKEEAAENATNAYFCGDSSFFSIHWALQTITREKLTGQLRAYWENDTVDLWAREGRVLLVTTRNLHLYCEESPVTLSNLDPAWIGAARDEQTSSGCPMFVTLVKEGLILREPGWELVQHYGQKLFARLWAADRVRFVFEQQEPPDYTRDAAPQEDNIDQWSLNTLRFVQYQSLGKKAIVDPTVVPAFTPDGYERVQKLRLTVAEAQLASQFNGARSLAQIAKNLRLDIKFARLTMFRFLALEIAECWPEQLAQKPQGRGLRGLFRR